MVLDSKAMEWASGNGLDTAALKKAKVPIYGKWYFPDLPSGVPMVNLHTGQVEIFGPGYRAGAILYAKEEDLHRAKLGPYAAKPEAEAPEAEAEAGSAAPAPAAEPAPATAPSGRAPAAGSVAAVAPAATEQPTAALPSDERATGTSDVAEAAATAPVGPSAVPGEPAVGREQPVRMLHHEDERGGAVAAAHGPSAHESVTHEPHHEVATHEQAHPSPRSYVNIAIVLAVITAIEVATYYIPNIPTPLFIGVLLVLSAVKFVMVVGWFMHLRFDHKSFTWYFGGGLAVALAVFTGMILMFVANPYGAGH